MTKKQIRLELKKAWNDTHTFEGLKIAHVGWKDYGRMVIENEETFEDAVKDDFVPIERYRTQKAMIDGLYKVINK